MLKLTMKPGESLRIGKDVKIILNTATYNRIQIEIEAPKEIDIQRQKAEKQEPKVYVVGNED